MRSALIYSLVFIWTVQNSFGQCSDPSFVSNDLACKDQTLLFENLLVPGYTYDWDFCAGDLREDPTATNVLANSNFFRARSIKFVQEGGYWYAFTISSTANNLMRLDFAEGLNSTPTFNNLGNVDNVLSGAFGFDLVKENGVYYMLVANGGSNNIIRYAFSSGIASTPQATSVSTGSAFSSSAPNSVRIVRDGVELVAFVSAGNSVSTTKVVRLDLGPSVVNDNPPVSEFTISGANQLRGMSFVKECDQWYGYGVAVSTNAMYRMSFGSDLKSTPGISTLYTGSLLNQPASIEIRNEMGEYYAYIQSARTEAANAGIYRVSFGSSISNLVVKTERILYPALVGGGYAFDMVNENSKWYGYTFNLSNQSLIRFDFPNNCGASLATLTSQSASVMNAYTSPSKYYVVLNGTDVNGAVFHRLDSVTVTASQAPDISFNTQNICANHDINFTSVNSSGDITGYDWDFGDAGTSSQENPTHQYSAAGDYSVTLNVTSSNGCENFAQKTLSVFDPPVADFTLPNPSQFCTNQSYQFLNTSITDPGYPSVIWQWSVNGVDLSQARDFDFTFTSTSNHDVTLMATIPGCSDQQTRSISALTEGPITSFTFSGQCQLDDIVFTNNSSGDITGYLWDFGDGQNSTVENPVHNYSTIGTRDVILTVTSSSGCNNSFTLPVAAYSKPATDFYAELPPFSCSGTDTYLKDQTSGPSDSNLSSWSWNFGDPGSSQNTSTLKDPSHIYDLAGDYTVDLTVTTDKGCSSNVQKLITVSQTPLIDFTSSPACKNVLTQLNDQTQDAVAWTWNINGTNYTNQNPSHTFATAGTKNISLHLVSINGCEASTATQVVVPEPLVPAFATLKTCANESAEFTDVTADTSDPIVNRKWIFLTQEINTASPTINHTFVSTGNVMVTMEVEASSGCKYTKTSNVTILDKPFSSFTATPIQGGAPLYVQFSNRSTGATSYLWEFGDSSESTSTASNPSFTYQDQGVFQVRLHASNSQQCSSTSSQFITANAPVIDAAITQLDITSTSPGLLTPVVTIVNNGNVVLSDFRLIININNETRLAEQILTAIPVSGLYTYEVPVNIMQDGVSFVCAELAIANDTDLDNNRNCTNIDKTISLLTPYPNPADKELLVEWIAKGESGATIRMTNSLGKGIANWTTAAQEGLNQLGIDTEFMSAGLYILTIETQLGSKSYRIVVEH